jgi:hypothetical protein
VLGVVVPPKFDLLSAVDRPEAALTSKREITGFGYGHRHAVCKLIEIHPSLSFNTRYAGSDIEEVCVKIVEGKRRRGVPAILFEPAEANRRRREIRQR